MIEDPYNLGKISEIAEKLEDIRDFIHEKALQSYKKVFEINLLKKFGQFYKG
ncbi:MAG: hypothetical protein ACFFCC_18385 [Promethearchaeota archaeon]